MLEDFIKANSLSAKILPYAAKGALARCRLFSSEKGDILAVYLASERPFFEKIAKALGSEEARPLGPEDSEKISGYDFEYMPPISIYGVKLVLDKKLASAEKLRFLVSETQTLEISPKEILESNDESTTAEITG